MLSQIVAAGKSVGRSRGSAPPPPGLALMPLLPAAAVTPGDAASFTVEVSGLGTSTSTPKTGTAATAIAKRPLRQREVVGETEVFLKAL